MCVCVCVCVCVCFKFLNHLLFRLEYPHQRITYFHFVAIL